MISWYLTSVAIYIVIIVCELYLFQDNMVKNGWKPERSSSAKSPVAMLIAVSAIPFFRLLMVVIFCIMATYTKEQFDEWIEKIQKED